MFSRGKYITGEVHSDHGMPVASAICFSGFIAHADVSKLFSEIWGAGFFTIENGQAKVEGKSIGLKVSSRGAADEKMINKALGLNAKE